MEEQGPCKRSRTNDGDDAGTGGGDRLSALPDCLLHEIMSRVQARQVVQTCVLSTRWRHLWRSVPCIDADEGEFASDPPDNAEVSWEKFQDFMDMLLSPGNLSIALLDKFRLRISPNLYYYDKKRGYRWIRRGIKYDRPAAGIQFQRQVGWRLRKLHLDNISLDALFAEHVGSGCPNLEDLELNDCRCEFHAITSGSLKKLVMAHCSMKGFSEITSPTLNNLVIDGGNNTKDCLLVITAPAAASASASVFLSFAVAYSFLGGFPVAKASLRLQASQIVSYLHILGSVSDVITNLELTDLETMVSGQWSSTFSQFNKLRVLELNGCDLSDGFQMLMRFLYNSPNLERLTLRHCKYSNESKKKRRSSKSKNTEPTLCRNLIDAQCKNLKLTEIIYQDEDICQLIELLLCISKSLPNNYIKLNKVG